MVTDSRRLGLVVCAALSAIAVVGAVQWYAVSTAQDRLTAEMTTMVNSLAAYTDQAVTPNSAASFQLPTMDYGAMPSRQAELVITRSATGILSTVAILLGTFAVSYVGTGWRLAALVAGFGWLVNGVLAAAYTKHGLELIARLPESMNLHAVTWRPPSGASVPFALYIVVGLASAFVWQGAVPGLIGWFGGSRTRVWRERAIPLAAVDSDEAAAVAAPRPAPVRCVCGAANLSSAASCYACGTALGTSVLGAVQGHEEQGEGHADQG